LTTIETTPPPSDWFYKVKDFNVSLRGKNGHFVEFSSHTAVSFGGPIGEGKVNFSEVFEYDVRRDPVRGLAWPNNEINLKVSIRLLAFKRIVSPRHVFNADVNVFRCARSSRILQRRAADAVVGLQPEGVSAGISEPLQLSLRSFA